MPVNGVFPRLLHAMIRQTHGDEVWEHMLRNAGAQPKHFLPGRSYSEASIAKLLQRAAEGYPCKLNDLLHHLGSFLVSNWRKLAVQCYGPDAASTITQLMRSLKILADTIPIVDDLSETLVPLEGVRETPRGFELQLACMGRCSTYAIGIARELERQSDGDLRWTLPIQGDRATGSKANQPSSCQLRLVLFPADRLSGSASAATVADERANCPTSSLDMPSIDDDPGSADSDTSLAAPISDAPSETFSWDESLAPPQPAASSHPLSGAASGKNPLSVVTKSAESHRMDSHVQSLKWLGRYRIDRLIDGGGMGLIFQAVDLQLQRVVAIKTPRDPLVSHLVRQRFLNEARSAAQLEHPNVIQIYDLGYVAERPYYVMEHLRGEPLQRYLRHRSIAYHDALLLIKRIGAGIAAVHRHGMVHRDLKPSNIFVNEDLSMCKLLDFGIATPAGDNHQQHSSAGTPGYIAPETIGAKLRDPRSDLFSLGCIAYELIYGRKLFPKVPISEYCKLLMQFDENSPEMQAIYHRDRKLLWGLLHPEVDRRFDSFETINTLIDHMWRNAEPIYYG